FAETDVKHGMQRAQRARPPRSWFRAVARFRAGLLRRIGFQRRFRLGRVVAAHRLLELVDGLAEIAADVLQAAGAEDQQDDHQHDQPMPDAEAAHISPLELARSVCDRRATAFLVDSPLEPRGRPSLAMRGLAGVVEVYTC